MAAKALLFGIGAVGIIGGFSLFQNRINFFNKPSATPPSVTLTQTCEPRPACLDQTPACKLAIPKNGWCVQKSTTTASQTKTSFGINIAAYSTLKDYLKPGDGVGVGFARPTGQGETPLNLKDSRVTSALAQLNAIDKNKTGLKKSMLFSSIQDLQNFINAGLIPADVDYISYNSEGGMTPRSERADLIGSVQKYADLVHSIGKGFIFGPLRTDFDTMQERGTLDSLLPSMEGIAYQGQLLYPTVSEDEFVNIIKGKSAYVKSKNPSIRFQVQLWLGRETPEQIISAFNKIQPFIDAGNIGPAGRVEETKQILQGLNWKNP